MGMGGVQRTAKFVKYLPNFNWQPFVLTLNPKAYLAKDQSLLNELKSKNIKIFRTGDSNESNGHKVVKFRNDSSRKILSNISQTFLLPDSKIFWKNKALKLAEEIISQNKIDLIYSTAPPYTDFLIACSLKKKFNIPVIIDYRDSWIDCPNNFYATPFHKNQHRKMETEVLKNADKVVTINGRIKELIIERYPFKKDRDIFVIPQGFDSEDFESRNNSGSLFTTDKFRITYSGSFLNYYTPEYFLKALKLFIDENPDAKKNVEAVFIGYFPNEYKRLIDELQLHANVNLSGYLEHKSCINHLIESDVLWMMINETKRSDLHSTGKLYEYFGTRKPIIACVPEGAARQSLCGHGAAELTKPDDVPGIKTAIQKYYSLYLQNKLPVANESFIKNYDRKYLTESLANILNSISMNEKVIA